MTVLGFIRKPIVGFILMAVAFAAIALVWRESWDAAWRLVRGAGVPALILALILYACALILIASAIAIAAGRSSQIWAAMTGQVLKYVPGAVWQGIPSAAEQSLKGVATYGLVTLGAACAGLMLSRQVGLVAIGAISCAVLLRVAYVRLGGITTLLAGCLCSLAALSLAGSGALVALSLGLEPVAWARDLITSWSLGVLSIPIPAGLGVRELALTTLASGDTSSVAAVATVHRVISLVGDLIVGTTGAAFLTRARKRQ